MTEPDSATAAWQDWIGREHTMHDSMDPFAARAMNALLDHAELLAAGDALPPAWHWLYFRETPSSAATGRDGHPQRGGFLPPIPLPRRMWAAGSLQIASPVRLGEPARRVSTIRSVERKCGRSGELVFVRIEHRLEQRGVCCVSEQQTLVYRALPKGPEPLPSGETAPPALCWRELDADPVLLFRFSALTYNAHRVHYDRNYAMHSEFYPGLVVHAPLLVTLLLDLAARRAELRAGTGRPLQFKRVDFRAMRPAFDGTSLRLCARREHCQLDLWSESQDRQVGMKVTVLLEEAEA